MSNLSLKLKFRAVFLAFAALFAGFGWFAIDRLAVVNSMSTEMEVTWLPRAVLLGTINTATSDYRIAEAAHILSLSEDKMAEAERDQERIRGAIDKAFDQYLKLVIFQGTRDAVTDVQAKWKSYLSQSRVMVEHSRKNENEKATELFRSSKQLFDDASAELTELSDIDGQRAAE
ncbi:MAG TPA: MCP four helix bundle domain-containing protein, partial [Azospirillaceae bacterium]|nr:MCP four helix bundle domain-containing protein [Azospirillaceae bacterium]